ncbi:MAG: type-F conjugative transfer system protein TraW [Gammaproteobacteria bacterium]|nr:type-F conjugative transfer system protein TraW [Gammaproteobacteria bacterium]
MNLAPRTALALALVLLAPLCRGEDLGVVGTLYPISEPDLLETIHARLRSLDAQGELASLEATARERMRAYAEHPEGIRLPRAARERVRYFDPTLVVPADIRDHRGHLIHAAGTTINPLDYLNLSRELLFFDGDDPLQAAWVRARLEERGAARVRAIATNGPVLELMRRWGLRVYFDQRGRLAEHFGITALPTRIRQAGRLLELTEVALEEEVE